jgi:hypothetical protein
MGDYQDKNNFASQQRCNALNNGLLPCLPLRIGQKCADAQDQFDRVYTMFFEGRRKQMTAG